MARAMTNDLFQAELSEPLARQGTQVFVHIALLPREEGEELCAISQRLAAQVPKEHVFYVLPTVEAPASWTRIVNEVLTGNPPVMPKAVSYPHVTLLHIWMEPEAAEALLDAFSRTAEYPPIPRIRVNDWVGRVSPRWRGGEFLQAPMDYLCFGLLAKTDRLLAVQRWAESLIPAKSGSRLVTGVGDSWTPHFTLLALQGDKRPSFEQTDHRELVIETPILAVGLSCLYGQFKTALAIAGTGIQVTPAADSIAMFKNTLAGTPG